jgi:uncharacterized protein YjbI with pentapeptide repeats
MTIEIHNRWTNACIWSGDIEDSGIASRNLGAAVVTAHKVGANLRSANLVGANLDGANLVGAIMDGANMRSANLVGANLDGANLVGANLVGAIMDGANLDGANLVGANLDGANLAGAIMDGGEKLLADGIRMVGPIGSRLSYCAAYATDNGLRFRAGCFFANPDEFRTKIAESHGDNHHAQDYLAWIAMCEAWFARLSEVSA